DLIINEVMPHNGDDDWIEIYAVADSSDISKYKLYEGTKLVKEFPQMAVSKGDYVILTFDKPGEQDETSSKGGNEYWDFYTNDSGLTSTDNSLTIRNSQGDMIDFVAYSNNDGTWSSANNKLFVEAVSTGMWKASEVSESQCVDWQKTDTETISRKYALEINPIDTNEKENWYIIPATKGAPNLVKKEEIFNCMITEIMPDNGSDDWLEIYAVEDCSDIAGYKLYEGTKLIKEFPQMCVSKGDYIILNFDKSGQQDETISKGVNGYWDFYTDDSGLTATDDSLVIRTSKGNMVDFVAYSNNDGSWSSTNNKLFSEAVSTGMWKASEISESECMIWDKTNSMSISRKYSKDTTPTDTNTSADWDLVRPTKGKERMVVIDDFSSNLDIKLLNTHFSPYGDFKHSALQIKYKNPENTQLTIYVYDVNAHCIKTLLDTSYESVDIIEWDGRNDNDDIVPVGVYIIFYRFINKYRGIEKSGKMEAVLGRLL
ncbi:hypothetical protein ACFL5N_02325, partial [bacterium]